MIVKHLAARTFTCKGGLDNIPEVGREMNYSITVASLKNG